jgi:anhydro-N-acetylmuramic acid kinase
MQIGDGYKIFKSTGIKTVFDLRSMDVALGGQGAPLVPIGDKLLFSHYDYCLNLGGFSNISFDHDGQRLAFDVGPVNTVLNHLAVRLGLNMMKTVSLPKLVKCSLRLLRQLNELPYYQSRSTQITGYRMGSGANTPIIWPRKKRLIFCILFVITLQIKSSLAVNLKSQKNKKARNSDHRWRSKKYFFD